MSDLEKLEKVFTEIGLKYEKMVSLSHDSEKNTTTISINEGDGYMDFYCQFYFVDGKFINHGVWE